MQSLHNPQATPVALKEVEEHGSDNAESVGEGEELANSLEDSAGDGLLGGKSGRRGMGVMSSLGAASPPPCCERAHARRVSTCNCLSSRRSLQGSAKVCQSVSFDRI